MNLCNKREYFDPTSYCVLIMFIPVVFIPAILIQMSKCEFTNCNLGYILICILFLIFNSTLCSVYKYNEYSCLSIAALISMCMYILITKYSDVK